ncbi:MAG: hypothetical protein JWP89_3709 [Schlesneria sp.]|nr:hypothetical protein [Schlesneria sp.]
MEFQGVIRSSSQIALGTIESVEKTLASLLPGISFEWTSSGAEKRTALESKGVEISPLVRKVLEPQQSNRCGSWSNNSIEVSVNLGTGGEVDCIWLTISGNNRSGNKLLETFRGIGWSPESPEVIEVVEVGAEDEIDLTGHATLFVERPSGTATKDPQ